MTVYAITIFLSAFLLFQVQPLIAKIILPWFGGSAAVWAAAMLFFQLVLLAGYAYAHVLIRYLRPKGQMGVHAGLLALSCVLLPILPSPSWKPTEVGDPTVRILMLLGATIGLPYFLLSSTSPLLQAWYVRRSGSGIPYRLFALSNFGSMLALLSFPFLVEPMLTSRQQAFTWSGAYVLFAAACAFAAWISRSGVDAGHVEAPEDSGRPGAAQLLLWVALAACASTLLISVTTHLSQNVAPIPLLWVVPLALYLLTFILAFESDRIYNRWVFLPLLVPALAGMAVMIWRDSGNLHVKWVVPGFAAGLFICCMMCHGELARRKPQARHLTLFYLMVSLGGALGGIFVALVAPRVFQSYIELQVGMVVCALLAIVVLWDATIPWNVRLTKLGPWPMRTAMLIAMGFLVGYLARTQHAETKGYRLMQRNFYGALTVRDEKENDYFDRVLMHGTINHGEQVLNNETLRYVATSYYGIYSGIGRAIRAAQANGPVRVGVVGLGAGVLSTYGREGDYYRIYEINPLVEKIAQTEFSFFPHSRADKKILMGDARLTMERQEPQQFDVLAVDAFSSDAIPVHLLTREAAALYFHHLKPNGILALHVSNRYLDLIPVCARDAEALNKQAMSVSDEGDEANYLSASTWVLVTSDAGWFKTPAFEKADMEPAKAWAKFRAWTDDYSNVIQIFRRD
jgi:spermidine synthase